ncbi:MAG TPA: MFS transporter [Steroidobacteraceae bacterium]|jgi:DHA2 family multidrug resistance protein-like MFS transporter|nr:MFS transporter [Steroidobacteraceae bacterium]
MPSPSASPAAGRAADGLPVPRRYWAIATIVLAITMSVLDSSIVNVAVPTVAHEFHATDAASIWVINAYQIAILIALLPLASLGEIVGYRRVSQCGLAVFTIASLACALAPTLTMLSIARVVQGLGAAGIMSVNSALVRFTYPQRMLGRGIGINAFAVAIAAATGPTIASAILAVSDWRWLFAVNVPIGLVTIVIALFALPETQRSPRRLNHVGVLLQAGTFALLVGGLQSFAHDASTVLGIAEIVGGCLLGVLLVRHEIVRDAPLIPFDLLRVRLFSLSVVTSVGSFMAATTALVALPFEIQRVGHTAAQTGLLMTPWPVGVAIAAPLAGRLADRHPAGILGSVGLLGMAAGLSLLALFPHDGTSADLIWRMALCGLGFGFFQSPNNRTLISAAPYARTGAAGGMLATARLLGQTLGAAGVAVLFRAYGGRGSNLALGAAAGIALAAAVVSASRLAANPNNPNAPLSEE